MRYLALASRIFPRRMASRWLAALASSLIPSSCAASGREGGLVLVADGRTVNIVAGVAERASGIITTFCKHRQVLAPTKNKGRTGLKLSVPNIQCKYINRFGAPVAPADAMSLHLLVGLPPIAVTLYHQ